MGFEAASCCLLSCFCLAHWMVRLFLVVLDGVGGLLFENYIVDASIFWKLLNGLFVGLLCVSLILSNLDIFE